MNLTKVLKFGLGPVTVAAIGLMTVPLMTWIFLPAVIGQLNMLNVFLSGCALVFTLGYDQAYVREYHEVNDKPELLKALFLVPLLVVFTFCLCLVIFHKQAMFLLFGQSTQTLYLSLILALAVIVTITYRFLSLVVRMQEEGLKFSILQISAKIFVLFFLITLFFIKGEFTFIVAFLLMCGSLVFSMLVAIYFNRHELVLASKSRFNFQHVSRASAFGTPLVISGFTYWGLISVDRWAIRYYSGLEELGIYTVAFSFAAVMTIFQQVFSVVWAPIVYRWHKEGADIKQFELVIDWVTIILSTVFIIVSVCSPVIALLLPDIYADVVFLVPACMLFPVFYTLSESTVVGMNIARKTSYSILITFVPLLINILGCYWMIKDFGAGGAAFSVALSFFCYFILRTCVSKYVWHDFSVWKSYLVSLLLFISATFSALYQIVLPWYIGGLILLIITTVYFQRIKHIKSDFHLIKS